MNITENRRMKSVRANVLDDRNYVIIGLTYDEVLDLQSLLDTIKEHYSQKSEAGNLWCSKNHSVLVPRDARMLINLSKKLAKVR